MKKQRGNTPLVIGAGPRNAGTNLRQDAEKRLHPQHRARPLRVLSRDAAQNGPHERVRPARQSGGPRTGSVRRRGPQPVIRLFIVTVLRLGQTDPFQTPPPPVGIQSGDTAAARRQVRRDGARRQLRRHQRSVKQAGQPEQSMSCARGRQDRLRDAEIKHA